jgi:5-methylcytosine-specific restriction enzyme subunit McrC
MLPIERARQQMVYRGREHSEVSLPLEALLENGQLKMFEEVRGKKYFNIYSKGTELVFQCGGFVGLIPINENVAIEVAPRIPVSNLDRVLSKGCAEHTLLSMVEKQYAVAEETAYLVDLLADALSVAIEDLIDWGKLKEYSAEVFTGHPRSGKILMRETLRARAKAPGRIVAATARFERSPNTLLNSAIKLSLEHLLGIYRTSKPTQQNLARVSRLNVAWLSFQDISVRASRPEIIRYAQDTMRRIETLSPPYKKAIPIAHAVLRGLGPSQRNLPPSFSLGSLIFNVADAFEGYVRECLKDRLDAIVQDGNHGAPTGAKRPLFHDSSHPVARIVPATPDILILTNDGAPAAVLDAKYKPYKGIPEREDVNQAISYAVLYETPICGLVFLDRGNSGKVEVYGKVGDITVVGISFALGADDLFAEEARFAHDVGGLLGLPLRSTT